MPPEPFRPQPQAREPQSQAREPQPQAREPQPLARAKAPAGELAEALTDLLGLFGAGASPAALRQGQARCERAFEALSTTGAAELGAAERDQLLRLGSVAMGLAAQERDHAADGLAKVRGALARLAQRPASTELAGGSCDVRG